MIELVPGRRYSFYCDLGHYVGTFDGKVRGRLVFNDVVQIHAHEVELPKGVDPAKLLDAEEWHQRLPFADPEVIAEARDIESHAKARGAVCVERAKVGKNW